MKLPWRGATSGMLAAHLLLVLGQLGAAEPKRAAATPPWSFLPPVRPTVPGEGPSRTVLTHPVDAFIRERLRREGLRLSPEADRATLLRRVSLDLRGLPPSLAEVQAFEADRRPDAYDRRVDQYLADPAYGERWGRWWLDAARYADSNGYSHDAPRSVWKYRDWVIDALNRDLPFDRFIVWQLAGDLLPADALPSVAAAIDARIATGFHRQTQINQEGGIDPEQFRVESVIDRVNTTATVFLGLTLGCAQCHDHKYDPFTQRDYYRLFAFFNSTVPDGHGADYPAGRFELPARCSETPAVPPVTTLVMQELPAPRLTHILVKGDFTRPAAVVTPGFPAALGAGDVPTSANRLDLARWLVSPSQPLTARVLVNRVWQQLFGRGLVETENDFGTQGTPPTHPALLDWLACEWVQPTRPGTNTPAWSLKHLQRLLVTSATYRQASVIRPELTERDPQNKFLARQSRLRLDAEIIRDVGLAVSGLLSRKMGGPPVYPPQPAGVMKLGQHDREWTVSEGEDRHRRAIYTHLWRATPHPALAVFDAPDAFSACTRRLRSDTPLQSLTLLNDPQFHEMAVHWGRELSRGTGAVRERLRDAFRRSLARRPENGELDALAVFLEREQARAREAGGQSEVIPWVAVARVLLNLDETITRE